MLDSGKGEASGAKPVRMRAYKGPISDPSRWEKFVPRAGDIFICAPAKSGTTWVQAICAMLIFGTAELDVAPAKISPWLDANLVPQDAVAAMIQAQRHRRYFKTHTPLDGIPFYPQCNYIAVYRDPRDTFFSMMQLARVTERGRAASPTQKNLHDLFAMWLREPFAPGEGEQLSLAAVAHHFNGFWKYRALPNIQLLHYSDLTRDLPAAIGRIAKALAIAVDDALVARMAIAASFANMRRNAQKFAPGIGRGKWNSESDFFRRGENDQWKDVLNEAEQSQYSQALAALVPADARAWLEHGSFGG